MELTIRDWMVIIGALLILAVLVDAVRRVRSEKYSRIKVKLVDPEQVDGRERDRELTWLKELPNGGARVVERGNRLRPEAETGAGDSEPPAQSAPRRAAPRRAAPGRTAPGRAGPGRNSNPSSSEPEPDRGEEEVELIRGISSLDDTTPGNIDWLDSLAADDARESRASNPPPPEPGKLPRDLESEVFMLNVVSRNPAGFRGEDILHILLACDLRYGDMNFFHRHEFEAGRGPVQFSVANMMQPGVFDIDKMSDLNTPGLVFFLTLPGPENMMQAFDYMLETAQTVARNLQGDVLDETRSALTRQTLEHSRQKIRDLERRLLAKAR